MSVFPESNIIKDIELLKPRKKKPETRKIVKYHRDHSKNNKTISESATS